jgi:hypothetical protein
VKFLIVNNYYSGTGIVPAPFSTNALNRSSNNDGGKSQNETLFNRGNAISTAPQWIGKK